jgi:hypothetical protein
MLPVSVGGKGPDARQAHEVLASYVDPISAAIYWRDSIVDNIQIEASSEPMTSGLLDLSGEDEMKYLYIVF